MLSLAIDPGGQMRLTNSQLYPEEILRRCGIIRPINGKGPEPELTYLFKHIVTQEVAYESLPYATRALLHGHLGQFIESNYQD